MNAPILEMTLLGGLANRMIEYMFAASLKRLVPSLVISNVDIPEFNIFHPALVHDGGALILPDKMRIDIHLLAELLNSGTIEKVSYSWYAQHMDSFVSDRKFLSSLFPEGKQKGFADGDLVMNIRGNEILDARHPSYVLVPCEFYRYLVDQTGLNPVFFGQIEENVYIDALKLAFPNAPFIPSQGALADFDILRKSRHLVPAISTFSWLAGLLSDAVVHLPVLGLYNPFQETDHMLLPLDDSRYRFYNFPILRSVIVDRFEASHKAIAGRWEAVTANVLRHRIKSYPLYSASKSNYLEVFDGSYYLSLYSDVLKSVGGNKTDAKRHFEEFGYSEKRFCFAFDEAMYLSDHVDCATAIGRGEYASARDHYVLVGRHFGYRAV